MTHSLVPLKIPYTTNLNSPRYPSEEKYISSIPADLYPETWEPALPPGKHFVVRFHTLVIRSFWIVHGGKGLL